MFNTVRGHKNYAHAFVVYQFVKKKNLTILGTMVSKCADIGEFIELCTINNKYSAGWKK